MKNYVIVGCGVAGVSAVRKIKEHDTGADIKIFTDESYPFYTRIKLPEVVAGNIPFDKTIIYDDAWFKKQGISFFKDEFIISIDPNKKSVISSNNKVYPYDKLLLATGSHCFIPPIAGVDKRGVFSLRNIKNALQILQYAKGLHKAVIIGGGLLGLEAANSLRIAGLDVSIMEFAPRLLSRQMDILSSQILQKQLENMGLKFYLGAQSKEILGDSAASGVLLADGQTISADLALVSAGVRPNLKLADAIGLKINKGVVVDDRLQTSTDDIYAAGDLIEHRGIFYGIWPAAEAQGKTAGINMAGGDMPYTGTVRSNSLKVVGIDLVSAGNIDADNQYESIIKQDAAHNIYRKLVIDDNRIIGCIFLGDIRGRKQILAAIDKRINIAAYKSDFAEDDFDYSKLVGI